MINEIQRHERYKQYTRAAYHFEEAHFPKGVSVVGLGINPKTGFWSYVLKNDNQIVIVYRGTDTNSSKDLRNDINMVLKKIPIQFGDALQLFDNIKNNIQMHILVL